MRTFYTICKMAAKLCEEDGRDWHRIDRPTRDAYLDRAENDLREETRALLHKRLTGDSQSNGTPDEEKPGS